MLIACLMASCSEPPMPKVLVFSKTAGFRHASIPAGIAAIQQLGMEHHFSVDTTEDAAAFREENLKQYAAVIFLNTTGDVLGHYQQADFERYIQAGGGYVGIHAAADTEYQWPWYGKLAGGYFDGHPDSPNVRAAELEVVYPSHPATSMLPERWAREDEWYNYKALNPDVQVLLNLDESTYEGGTNGSHHPIALFHEYDGGRAFYTGGGHTEAAYAEPLFLQHLAGGIQYAIGENRLDYSLARTARVPEQNRFQKTVLASNLFEPMEIDLLPDGRILLIERRGGIKMYDPERGALDSIGHLPVHTEHEDGLMGLAVDPAYEDNHWIYLCYSPVGEEAVQQVSRFVFAQDSVHWLSEQVILKIPVQREECCHSAGSLEFGPDGNLFISVGDNTNPFESEGYAPIDERPGRAPFDAQRTAANTNDLRGKILRITPQPDGSYTIPEGNLFPEGTPGTRPEIYVMGCRNPFRFSIDARTGYLYWGDVGPDAGVGREQRGPKGIDEINQAREAGFFGWPYLRGNLQAYHDFDFASNLAGPQFSAQQPVNESPNNTGLRELPPVQPSMIWYSYDKSKEFPWVGVGGKNPMAGPVYYAEQYENEDKYPDYFNGKLFVYEWMRDWIFVLTLDEDGRFVQADPFLSEQGDFANPMDMLFGPDGQLYVLEYGEQWFTQNADARLSRIAYIKGNRKPAARIEAAALQGAVPLKASFSAAASYDPDRDPLQFDWQVDGQAFSGESLSYTFEQPGTYTVQLKATDPDGNTSEASVAVMAGNEPPQVNWSIAGNRSFYWDGRTVAYEVAAKDKEDGQVPAAQLKVSVDYLAEGYDLAAIAQGHQQASSLQPAGLALIEGSDCKACHAKDKKINGPSYLQVAEKYAGDPKAPAVLARRIREGSSGVWGETAMSAHPQLTEAEASHMVAYILSLAAAHSNSLPAKGQYTTDQHLGKAEKGRYVFMASYTDRPRNGQPAITRQEKVQLRYHRMPAAAFDEGTPTLMRQEGSVGEIYDGDHMAFRSVDLAQVNGISLEASTEQGRFAGGEAEVRTGSPSGPLLGRMPLPESGKATLPIAPAPGLQDVYLVFRAAEGSSWQIARLDAVTFEVR